MIIGETLENNKCMRWTLILGVLGVCILIVACWFSSQYNLAGNLAGITSDTLLIRSYDITLLSVPVLVTDTVPLKNGQFALNLGGDNLKQVIIMEKPSLVPDLKGRIPAFSMKSISLLLLPGKKVVVNGTLDKYTLSGDILYDTYSSLQEQKNVYAHKLDSLSRVCMRVGQEGISADSIRVIYVPAKEWMNAMREIAIKYIKQHPDQDASVFLLAQSSLRLEVVDSLLELISEDVRKGLLRPLYEKLRVKCDKEKVCRETSRIIKEGVLAPAFTLKDIEGKDFSLSSLKGKYGCWTSGVVGALKECLI